MKQVEFITLEDEQDLIVSFALAPSGEESLTLLRAPHYEHLLPEQDRRATVSLSSQREEGDYVKSVLIVRCTEQCETFLTARRKGEGDNEVLLVFKRDELDFLH